MPSSTLQPGRPRPPPSVVAVVASRLLHRGPSRRLRRRHQPRRTTSPGCHARSCRHRRPGAPPTPLRTELLQRRALPACSLEAGVVEFIHGTVDRVAVHVDVQGSSAYARRASARCLISAPLSDLTPLQEPRRGWRRTSPRDRADVLEVHAHVLDAVASRPGLRPIFVAPRSPFPTSNANATGEGEDLGEDFGEEGRADDS
nr:uncharacterized protein LOC127342194 [Lolium perenne]